MRCVQLRRDDRCRRIGAHAAGVRSLIAVVAALVVLRGGERQHLLVARHHDEADFLALQELLDHDGVAGGAETAAEHGAAAAAMAASWVSQMTTPLPAAKPSALTTSGSRCART